MRAYLRSIVIGTAFLGLVSAISAAELKVQIDELAELTPDQQAELVKQMKEKSLLDKDDTVVNSSTAAKDKSVGTAVLLTLGPAACRLIAATKKEEDLKSCLAETDEAKQASCKKSLEERFGAVETVCSLVKLF
jgi:hypothetical protein